jgi:hypothetical protein
MTPGIPRVIHRIWLGDHPMPVDFVAFGETWRALHPEWRQVLWTDHNLPPMTNQWVYDMSLSFAAKANVLRYEILNNFGGVYVDTDFECRKPIDELIENVECFVARQPEGLINNAIIGTPAGRPFIAEVVRRLGIHARYVTDDIPSVTQSGPFFFTRVADGYPGLTVFGPELFYPYAWNERWRRDEAFPDAYAVHHWTLSGRAAELPSQRCFGTAGKPAIAVLVAPDPKDDGRRLEWVLEALKVQTVLDFELFVVDPASCPEIRARVEAFRTRHPATRLFDGSHWKLGRPTLSGLCDIAMASVTAPRLLILDGACVPDSDMLEAHVAHGDDSAAPFAFARRYPAAKLYRFRPPMDYPGLRSQSRPDPRMSGEAGGFHGDWRDVRGCAISLPARKLKQVGGLAETNGQIDFPDLARRLSGLGMRLLPQFDLGAMTLLES